MEYDGAAYAGWQRQSNGLAVQEVLEGALARLLGAPTPVTGASRTDAGVHALGQVAHFDTEASIPPAKYALALNTMLPADVRVAASCEAAPDFHARFSTTGKRYTYLICNGTHAPALMRNFAAFVPVRLDADAMASAAALFTGTHDFRCAMAAGNQSKTTVRTIYSFTAARTGDWIELDVSGNGFLYNMVRIMAGTLIRVGLGKLDKAQIARAMELGDRTLLGYTAPPQGLVLREVFY